MGSSPLVDCGDVDDGFLEDGKHEKASGRRGRMMFAPLMPRFHGVALLAWSTGYSRTSLIDSALACGLAFPWPRPRADAPDRSWNP
ncbi:hypothetical protein ACIBQ1_59225 [Nonomuraea sp. NPDC050153]|uniref:hypothetical protein n=1 Tax=Nonomuraea sp. NPDC050153 TaxID=3364359 RepID=UPI0037A359FB